LRFAALFCLAKAATLSWNKTSGVSYVTLFLIRNVRLTISARHILALSLSSLVLPGAERPLEELRQRME